MTRENKLENPESGKERPRLRKAERQKRERDAAALGLSGALWVEIAERLGFANASGAWKAAQRVYDRQEREEIGPALELELARLDRLQLAIWQQASQGHLGAIDRFLNISRHRARLIGMEAPEKVDHSSGGGPLVVHMNMPAPDKTIVPEAE